MNIDSRIIGTWALRSTQGRDDAGQVLPPPYGPKPEGLVTFQADGRMMCVLCDGRAALPPGEPRQFMSYAGNYSFDGETLTTRVDASSDAARVGGDQVRTSRSSTAGWCCAPRAGSMPASCSIRNWSGSASPSGRSRLRWLDEAERILEYTPRRSIANGW